MNFRVYYPDLGFYLSSAYHTLDDAVQAGKKIRNDYIVKHMGGESIAFHGKFVGLVVVPEKSSKTMLTKPK